MSRSQSKKSVITWLNGDLLLGLITKIVISLISALLCSVFVFTLIKGIPGIQHYGWKNIFLTTKFDLFNKASPKAGIWLPILVMFLVGFITTTLASILGVRTSLFLKFRTQQKIAKKIKIVIDLLASIPAVIYGIFCINTFSPLLGKLFKITYGGTLISASITMSFMILPIIISFVYEAADKLEFDFFLSSVALGNTKTHVIHKIVKKKIRPAIVIAIIFGSVRILCETSAMNMILSKVNYNEEFNHGFWNVLFSGLKPLGVIIPAFFFTDTSSQGSQGVLYIFGIIIFVFAMIINAIIFYSMRLTNTQTWIRLNYWFDCLMRVIFFVPRKMITFICMIIFPKKNFSIDENLSINNANLIHQIRSQKTQQFFTVWKTFFDYFLTFITFSFTLWILLNLSIKGVLSFCAADSSVFSNASDSTGRAFINTIILISLSMIIAFPISLVVAIGLAEFTKNKKIKQVAAFFMDSLSSTPSILFGLFGLIFFVRILGWTDTNNVGHSLVAGILTITLLILPSYSRGIQNGIESVDEKIKLNSFALGTNKLNTIRRVILPMALNTTINSSILAVSRILSETSPIFLTAGLNSSREINLLRPAQTLTTRIYAQMFQTDLAKVDNAEYSSSLLSILLLLLLIFAWQLLLPFLFVKKSKIKEWVHHRYQLLRFWRYIA